MLNQSIQMFYSALFLGACLCFPVITQAQLPTRIDPLPPPQMKIDETLEPVVMSRAGRTDEVNVRKVEEFRIRGRLYMRRITDTQEKIRIEVDANGSGHFERQTEAQALYPLTERALPNWVTR